MEMMTNQRGFRRFGFDVLLPVLLLAALTAFFIYSKWDLKLIDPFFDHVTGRFPLNRTFWPRISYYVVPFLGIGMGLAGLVVMIGSRWVQRWKRFRKEAAFLFLLVALGPGLFVNGIFKEHFGRPRPNQCEVFGGKQAFQPVLKYVRHEKMYKYQSFPCGHASIGFVLMGPYFFLRYRNRRRARLFMLLGLLFGAWAGVARMMEGRHFASDVIWAAGMVYFIGLVLAKPFKFEEEKRCADAQ